MHITFVIITKDIPQHPIYFVTDIVRILLQTCVRRLYIINNDRIRVIKFKDCNFPVYEVN